MDKNSTPSPVVPQLQSGEMSPGKKTLDFVRQFARVYAAVTNMPGVVLN